MKKIGFVDYYLSEWHANNYPTWMAPCELSSQYKIAYAWAELDFSPEDGVTTDEWCEKNGAKKCDTIEELCEKSDVIIILAPSNPEKHLGYAEKVFKYGKRTYIDKTFAPDLETAKKIFAIAEKYGTPFFSSSALRYASELDDCGKCNTVMTMGGGDSVGEYIIHQAEMLVKKIGTGAEKMCLTEKCGALFFNIIYNDDREAAMMMGRGIPFSAFMTVKGNPPKYRVAKSKYFESFAADVLRFFEEGTTSFDVSETLEVMKLCEGAIRAEVNKGEWITL